MQFALKMIPIAGAIALALAGSAYAEEQVVKIGHTGPLSGSNAFAGKDDENGVQLAVEELNAKKLTIGGKQIKFELQSEDDQCDPESGVNAAQKLVDSGVKFVLGPFCSGVAIPASRIYNEAGVMMSTVAPIPRSPKAATRMCFGSSPAIRKSAPAWRSMRPKYSRPRPLA